MQKSFYYHVCWVTGTQFSLSPHSSISYSMSESHLESWRQLVWFSSFEKVLFLCNFSKFSYLFVQPWRLYWEILSSSGSPHPRSPTIIVDEGRRILTDHSWHELPYLCTPAHRILHTWLFCFCFGPLLIQIYRVKHLSGMLEICRIKLLYWYRLWLQYP